MDGLRRRVAWIPALLVFAAIPLIPDPPVPVERVPALDLERVRSAECEYRGITASFDELTRAYALTAFQSPRLQGWRARPNPASPETEALVEQTMARIIRPQGERSARSLRNRMTRRTARNRPA